MLCLVCLNGSLKLGSTLGALPDGQSGSRLYLVWQLIGNGEEKGEVQQFCRDLIPAVVWNCVFDCDGLEFPAFSVCEAKGLGLGVSHTWLVEGNFPLCAVVWHCLMFRVQGVQGGGGCVVIRKSSYVHCISALNVEVVHITWHYLAWHHSRVNISCGLWWHMA